METQLCNLYIPERYSVFSTKHDTTQTTWDRNFCVKYRYSWSLISFLKLGFFLILGKLPKLSPHGLSTTRYPHMVYPPRDIPTWYIHHEISPYGISTTRYPHMVYPPRDIPTWYIHHEISPHGISTTRYPHILYPPRDIPTWYIHHGISPHGISTKGYPHMVYPPRNIPTWYTHHGILKRIIWE